MKRMMEGFRMELKAFTGVLVAAMLVALRLRGLAPLAPLEPSPPG